MKIQDFEWRDEQPDHEGWFFWRRKNYESDPYNWSAYFRMDDGTFFADGMAVTPPTSGQWALILLC